MPLKIRCPHCRRVLLAEEEFAGQDKACPDCGKIFNIPVPISERGIRDAVPSSGVVSKCPHCGYDIAPGTSFCQKCKRDIVSGKRIPLAKRLRLVSLGSWTLSGLIAVGVPLLSVVGYNIYRDRFARPDTPTAPFVPVAPREVASREWAEKLLSAASRSQRAAAVYQLSRMGPRAVMDLAAALQANLQVAGGDRRQQRRNREAAIRFLGAYGKGHCERLLAETSWPADVRDEVVVARALLGDAEVLDQLSALWLDGVRTTMFLTEAIHVGRREATPESLSALRRAVDRNSRLGRVLHGFEREAFVRVAPHYWDGWAWLGQQRDDVLAARLFELAKPARDMDSSVRGAVDDLRAARVTLESVARNAADAVKPVAAILLVSFAPQYRSALNRMRSDLAKSLRSAVPMDQQRITWALARMTGRQFGAITGRSSPSLVRHTDVAAALKWIRDEHIAMPEMLHTSASSYSGPPRLTRRVITVNRQIEHDLLARISGDWPAAREAVDEWITLGLGCTPRVRAWLDPSQRSPHYPALMGAMMIVADCNETAWRRPLTIWRQAGDQPRWVRTLAATALASLDAQSGAPIERWPEELSVADLTGDGSSGPSLADLARVIATGGADLVDRLAQHRPEDLTPTVHARLVATARRALKRSRSKAP